MQAHLPHWGLFVGGLFLMAGLWLIAAGEVSAWAARRHIPNPARFAFRVWTISSLVWAFDVVFVSLPIAFWTDVPATEAGRRLLGLSTFLPLPVLFGGAWYLLSNRSHVPSGRQ